MIENLEALLLLDQLGTMVNVSTRLKISQSAVSKRIAAVEKYYDRKLIERSGRRVVLTMQGRLLVDRIRPLVQEVRSVFLEDNALRKGRVIVGVSEAILASWGAPLFAQVQGDLPDVQFEFHAHRSPVLLDRIRSGDLMVAVCTGSAHAEYDLLSDLIGLEPMVIIPSGLKTFKYQEGDQLDVITIESRSGAWSSIENDMKRLGLNRAESLESFFAVAQMALAGFGHGLVPEGVAHALGLKDSESLIHLGNVGLNRPIRFVARKSMFSRPLIRSFYRSILQRTKY